MMIDRRPQVALRVGAVQPNYDRRVQYVLQNLITLLGADSAALYTVGLQQVRVQVEAIYYAEGLPTPSEDAMRVCIAEAADCLLGAERFGVRFVHFSAEQHPFRHGMIYPMMLYGEMIGALVIATIKDDYFTQDHVKEAATLVELTQTVMENRHLAERLLATEGIGTTARAIASNPSPQNIVHVLRDYLFDAHITSCFIAFFGPVRPEHPNAPYRFLEVVASWSDHRDSRVTIGTRFEFPQIDADLERLNTQKLVTYDAASASPTALNPLERLTAEAQHIATLTLMLLESDERRLGVLGIITEHAHTFSDEELRTYQIVTEFLTMSTLSAALAQQADFVRQGRAALLDAVTDGVVMVLPDETSTILTINERFSQMFGVAESEVQGRSLRALVEAMRAPRRLRQQLHKQWQAIAPSAPTTLEGEFTLSGSTGAHTDIQWYSGPVYREGEVIGRIYTFHDVTPERMAERLRYELLSRISHELRTPLTSIRGFAEFILQAHPGDALPPLAREYTGIIHNSAIHLNHLVTDIIEITRANAGQIKLYLTDADLTDVILQVIARLEPQVKAREQRVVMDLDDTVPSMQIDVDRIDQVLTNLVSNAIKYGPEASQVRIISRAIFDEDALPQDAPTDVVVPCVLISVLDEGAGLSPEDVEQVFLPFYRTAAARKHKIEGAGLGLAIAQSIVELHRGQLWAQAATRRAPGGRFFVTLPLE